MWPNYRSGTAPQPPAVPNGPVDGWSPALSSNTQHQWASYYQSMAPQQVDWAMLAQQWIQMKTDGPEAAPGPPQPPLPPPMNQQPMTIHHIPQAPPPPGISEGGGEANMDLEENGDDAYEYEEYSQPPPFPDVYHSRAIPPRPLHGHHEEEYHQQPHHHHHHMQSVVHHHQPHGRHHYQHQQSWGSDGWGNNRHAMAGPIPPLMGGATNQDYSFSNLNAEARKKLPAWIREGLEKMEREKQKKEEDEIRAKLREEKLKKRRQEELERQNEEGGEVNNQLSFMWVVE